MRRVAALMMLLVGCSATPSTVPTTGPASPEASVRRPEVSASPTPVATVAVVTFEDGTHRVGVDLSPGTYRAIRIAGLETEDFCYWERVSGFGGSEAETIANSAGVGPRVVTIEAADAGFISSGCGTWTSDLSALEGPITDGVWIVGVDVEPGSYRSEGGDLCLWQRLAGFEGSDAASLEVGVTPVVQIRPGDVGFMSMHCGRWQADQ